MFALTLTVFDCVSLILYEHFAVFFFIWNMNDKFIFLNLSNKNLFHDFLHLVSFLDFCVCVCKNCEWDDIDHMLSNQGIDESFLSCIPFEEKESLASYQWYFAMGTPLPRKRV